MAGRTEDGAITMPPDASALEDGAVALLHRLASRRERGGPTISTLIGPPTPSTAITSATEPSHLVKAWLLEVLKTRNLHTDTLTFMAARTARDPIEFLSAWPIRTARERGRFWESNPIPDLPGPILALCRETTWWSEERGRPHRESPRDQLEHLGGHLHVTAVPQPIGVNVSPTGPQEVRLAAPHGHSVKESGTNHT